MSPPGPQPSLALLDAAWRIAFRLGFPLARIWWRLRRARHEGALVAVYVDRALLLVRSPIGSSGISQAALSSAVRRPSCGAARVGRGNRPWGTRLLPAGDACGIWDRRSDRVHFFELQLDRLPKLQLDNREIIGARLVSPESWATSR